MKLELSKREALELVKAFQGSGTGPVWGVVDKLEAFLADEEGDHEEVQQDREEAEITDEEADEALRSGESLEEGAHEEGDGEDVAGECEEGGPAPDIYVSQRDLEKLPALKSQFGKLEFVNGDLVSHGNVTEMEGVTHLTRYAKELHASCNNSDWEIYLVERFPKAWTKLLPLGKLAEVE